MQTVLPSDTVGNVLDGKRVILASASPRRREILEDCLGWKGFEVVPSTFEEDLDKTEYEGRELEYPVDTAAQKVSIDRIAPSILLTLRQAIEVYEREVVSRTDAIVVPCALWLMKTVSQSKESESSVST